MADFGTPGYWITDRPVKRPEPEVDVVERLRSYPFPSPWERVMTQAADEIERLRARIAELEGLLDRMQPTL